MKAPCLNFDLYISHNYWCDGLLKLCQLALRDFAKGIGIKTTFFSAKQASQLTVVGYC